MPIKDDDTRRAYFRNYMKQRRAGNSKPKPATLSKKDQKSLDAYKRKLDREFELRVHDAAQAMSREGVKMALDYFNEREEFYNACMTTRPGIMNRQTFRKILARLHPDVGGNPELFDTFKKLEKKLLDEAESPTPKIKYPSDLDDLVRRTEKGDWPPP